ncbi:MAG: MT-A70 family methyltransferase [Pseudomonadota bacterium]
MAVFGNFSEIPLFTYDVIMADAAWLFELWSKKGETKAAQAHYDCEPLEKIRAYRVADLARSNCLLWFWTTNPMLRQAFDVLDAWDFKYVTGGHWVKTTKNQAMSWGPGYVLRTCGEPYYLAARENGEIEEGSPFVLGKIGSPSSAAKNIPSVIFGERREHSRKPESAYRALDAMFPGARKLDLFSRTNRPGWDAFGDEAGKFAVEGAS